MRVARVAVDREGAVTLAQPGRRERNAHRAFRLGANRRAAIIHHREIAAGLNTRECDRCRLALIVNGDLPGFAAGIAAERDLAQVELMR